MRRPLDTISPHELARLAIELFVGSGGLLDPPTNPRGVLAIRAGTFVTLRTYDGHLRGCIGTIQPEKSSVAQEIITNAIGAASRDPRFSPVSPDELALLSYGVDVLAKPEPIEGLNDLDPSRFGVIISTPDNERRALLLPRIDGISSAFDQWEAVHFKAGIPLGTKILAHRFTVTRFGKD